MFDQENCLNWISDSVGVGGPNGQSPEECSSGAGGQSECYDFGDNNGEALMSSLGIDKVDFGSLMEVFNEDALMNIDGEDHCWSSKASSSEESVTSSPGGDYGTATTGFSHHSSTSGSQSLAGVGGDGSSDSSPLHSPSASSTSPISSPYSPFTTTPNPPTISESTPNDLHQYPSFSCSFQQQQQQQAGLTTGQQNVMMKDMLIDGDDCEPSEFFPIISKTSHQHKTQNDQTTTTTKNPQSSTNYKNINNNSKRRKTVGDIVQIDSDPHQLLFPNNRQINNGVSKTIVISSSSCSQQGSDRRIRRQKESPEQQLPGAATVTLKQETQQTNNSSGPLSSQHHEQVVLLLPNPNSLHLPSGADGGQATNLIITNNDSNQAAAKIHHTSYPSNNGNYPQILPKKMTSESRSSSPIRRCNSVQCTSPPVSVIELNSAVMNPCASSTTPTPCAVLSTTTTTSPLGKQQAIVCRSASQQLQQQPISLARISTQQKNPPTPTSFIIQQQQQQNGGRSSTTRHQEVKGGVRTARIQQNQANSAAEQTLPAAVESSTDFEIKRELRKIRNREAAQQSRQKRKEHIDSLERHLNDSKRENEKLKMENQRLLATIAQLQQENERLKRSPNNNNNMSSTPKAAGMASKGTTSSRLNAPILAKAGMVTLMAIMCLFTVNFSPYLSTRVSQSSDSKAELLRDGIKLGGAIPHFQSRTLMSMEDKDDIDGRQWLSKERARIKRLGKERNMNDRTTAEEVEMMDQAAAENSTISKENCRQFYHVNQTESRRLTEVLNEWMNTVKEPQQQQQQQQQARPITDKLPKLKPLHRVKPSLLRKPYGSKRFDGLRDLKSLQIPEGYGERERGKLYGGGGMALYRANKEDGYLDSLMDALNTRDDTFYLVSFAKDYLMLPATRRNSSSLPRMSLIVPLMNNQKAADNSSNNNFSSQSEVVAMMQIECEVTGTELLHLPTKLVRRKQSTPPTTANDKQAADSDNKPTSANASKRQNGGKTPLMNVTTNHAEE